MKKVISGNRPSISDIVPEFFRDLIERCWSQEPKDRPSFAEIVDDMKTDDSFITDLIDELEFYDYIEYIDKCGSSFSSTNRLFHFEYFINCYGRNKILKKINIDKDEISKSTKDKDKEKKSLIIIQNNLIFDLDEEEKTAAIVGNKYKNGDLIIPRSIMHEKQEYIITSIKKGAFKYVNLHNSIQFSDSELRIIEKEAFEDVKIDGCLTLPPHVIYINGFHAFTGCSIKKLEITSSLDNITIEGFSISSHIEEISIPSNANLKDNWCFLISTNKIQIVENKQKNIQYYDNNLIIGKSDINSDEFDVLFYAYRDLKTVIIPML